MSSCMISKKSNCKNCYKCIRHCPVKAIRFSGNQAHIIDNECILCGRCYAICPQDAKVIVSEVEKVRVLIQSGSPVIASIAPSFITKFKSVGIENMAKALQKLGFYNAEETAIGATIVKNEYERMLKEEEREVVISSCCHSINLLIQKYYPKALMYLADVLSPMQAHGEDIKKRFPEAKVVFIGPCIAKKDEADFCGDFIDAAITFEELEEWLASENVELEKNVDSCEKSRARFFPVTGGILKTMACDAPGYEYVAIDGVENCMEALKEIEEGRLTKCFIEMSACAGGCVNGPAMGNKKYSPVTDFVAVKNYAGREDFEVNQPQSFEIRKTFDYIAPMVNKPSDDEIMAVLKQMGKFKASDELNCGLCGYNTCRDKAVAVCQGKAEISMCLPFLKDKAESFSDTIVKNTPNGLIALNESLEVQQINEAARRMLNVRYASDILGEPVIRILDPKDFVEVLRTHRDVRNKRVYLTEYKRYTEQTIVYDEAARMLIAILRDVTDEEKEREKKESISRQTVEVADKVVEKQMRIVQEIASLLGETAAETKIALSKLKESIADE
ncbi:MAG: 4Fe-4S dicluster domain-containing protein [Clostridia bacterium]|nr:4Fe-4S dicluster domain-containing protein [Clostridia bacterium]